MNDLPSSLDLDLPLVRLDLGARGKGVDPAQITNWINRAFERDEETIKWLRDLARIVNGAAMPPAERLNLTKLLAVRAKSVLVTVARHLQDTYPTPNSDGYALGESFSELLDELSVCHLRVVEEFEPPLPVAKIGMHLRLALALVACLSVHRWFLGLLEPARAWKRIHHIIAAADQIGALAEPAGSDEECLWFVPDRLERLAGRIGVLASSQPWSLDSVEILALTEWIQTVPVECASYALAAGSFPDTSSRLWLSLDGECAPSLIVGRPPKDDTHAWCIELQPVLTVLHTKPQNLSISPQAGSEPLHKRLRKRWAVPLALQFHEGPAHAGPFAVGTGVTECHALVHADIHGQRSPSAIMSNMLPGGFFAAAMDDPHGIPAIFKAGLGYREARESMNAGAEASPGLREVEWLSPRRLEHLVETWEATARQGEHRLGPDSEHGSPHAIVTAAWLRNCGAGNVSLLLQAHTRGLRGGGLLALRIADQEKILWKLAQIRWLRLLDKGRVSLGAEYLADACWPIRLHLIDSKTPIDEGYPGFFFRDRGRPEVGVLLFASHVFPPGARVAFKLFRHLFTVTLRKFRPVSASLSVGEFPNPLRAR